MANNDNLTVIPAYGRDYTSQAAVQAAWNEDNDFIIQGISADHGRAINKQDADSSYGTTGRITVRYAKLQKAYIIKR